MRRPSSHYITRGRLKFRFVQVMINAVALMAIAGGLAAYFRAYPTAVRYVNKTVTTTIAVVPPETNPAPGKVGKKERKPSGKKSVAFL